MNTKTYEQIIQNLLIRIEDLEEDRLIYHDAYYNNRLNPTERMSEFSKTKLFMEVYNALSGNEKNDVNENDLIIELSKTGKFPSDEPVKYTKLAISNGWIYERRNGLFAKP